MNVALFAVVCVFALTVHGWQVDGVWQVVDSQVRCTPQCLHSNIFTDACSCPADTSASTFRVLNDCQGPDTLGGGNVALCLQSDYIFGDSAFGGAFQLDDAAVGTFGCRVPNRVTGACNCPYGFQEIVTRALVDTVADGPIIGSDIVFCANTMTHLATDVSLFGGAFQKLDSGACSTVNPFSKNCSCPPLYTALPFRAIADGPEGSFTSVCVKNQGPPPPVVPPSVMEPRSWYINAAMGNDEQNNGTQEFPFATIQRGLLASESSQQKSGHCNVTLHVAGGVYYQNDALTLNSSVCGSLELNTFVHLRGEQDDNVNASVIISGGEVTGPLSLWRSGVQNGSVDLYRVTLDTVEASRFIWQLWVEERDSNVSISYRRVSLTARATSEYTAIVSTTPPMSFTIPSSQAPPFPADYSDAMIVMYHSWTSTTNTMASYDPLTGTVTLEGSAPDNIYNTASGNRYRFVNLPEFDAMEAWSFHYNRTSRQITLAVPAGIPSDTLPVVVVPMLSTVLSVGGGCRNLVVSGVTVAHTDSFLESQCLSYGCSGQSGSFLQNAAVEVGAGQGGAAHVFIQTSVIAHVGQYALWFHQGSNSISATDLDIFDLGAGGVRIGEENSGTISDRSYLATSITISNTDIHDGGFIVEAGTGVLLQQAASCSITHSAIHDLYYTAVSTGWTWGYAATSNNNIYVAFNKMYNLGRGVLSDMGCVYNLGISPGTVVDNNVCHDMQSFGYGGWGLYSDEGTSFISWTNNIVYRTKSAPYHQHYGQHNIVLNNVFAFPEVILGQPFPVPNSDFAGIRSSPSWSGSEHQTSFTLTRNIVLLRNASATLFFSTIPRAFVNVSMNDNVYFNLAASNATLQFPCFVGSNPCTWSWWQSLGEDAQSILQNPEFVNADGYDFSLLSPSSPATSLGFIPIDTTNVGPTSK